MKISVIITLKKDVLDPQGKVIHQTLDGMGFNDVNEVSLPIKKFDMKKEFKDAILLYRKNDYEQALNKFEKLSDLGDAKSQHNLAVMYYKGQGIPQNFNRAYYWSIMSMLNGQKKAEILMKNNQKRVNDINKIEIESEVKDLIKSNAYLQKSHIFQCVSAFTTVLV